MSWSVLTAQEEKTWFEDYVGLAIGSQPKDLPPKFQTLGSTRVSWWEGPAGQAVIMSEGGSHDDRHLAEQIVYEDLKPFGYRRAHFTLFDNSRTATWDDVKAKAVRLKNNGQVTILRNGWNVVVSNVTGDHGEYECTISRDDPNSMAITQWTCECPWDQYAFQRTRKWKYLEGRSCSHVIATMWQAMATPIDDYDPNIHGQMPRGMKKTQPVQQGQLFDKGVGQAPGGGGPTNEVGTGGGVPKGVDKEEIDGGGSGGAAPGAPSAPTSPTGPSMGPAGPSAPSAPSAPSGKPNGAPEQLTGQPAQVPKPSPSRGQGQSTNPMANPSDQFDVIPDQPGQPGEQLELPFSQPKADDQTGGRNIHMPGALSRVLGKTYTHVRTAAGEKIFNQEDVVQLLPPRDAQNWNGEYGAAVGGAPGNGTGEMVLVGPNSVGKVFSYDPTLDWVTVHFPLHQSGELQPHFVECILPSSQLAPRPDISDPFMGPR